MSLVEHHTFQPRRKLRRGNAPRSSVPEQDTRSRLITALRFLGAEWSRSSSGVAIDIMVIVAGNDRIDDVPDRALAETANGLCQILDRRPVVRFGPRRQIVDIADLR